MVVKTNEDDDYERETRCGWFRWRPSCLSCFNSAPCLLSIICGYALLHGITGNGFTNVAITSIERRFELSSSRSGLIPPTYDIVAAICIVFVSFVGSHGRKPRWLGAGLVCLAIGSIIFTLPHFLAGTYQYGQENATGLCPENNITNCEMGGNTISAQSQFYYLFIVAQIFVGLGAPAAYSLGVTFIDESVSSKSAGLYLGILSSCFIIGPAFGFIIGSGFLNLYTDFLTVDTSTLTIDATSTQWVGAWWLGYIFAAIFMLLLVIPISCLPPELKGTRAIQDQRISQAHRKSEKNDENVNRSSKGSGVKWGDLPRVIKSLLTNPTYVCTLVASLADGVFIGGAEVFLPKFLETQFGLTASSAALQTGLTLVLFGGGGLFVTGWAIKRFDLKVRGMLKLALVSSAICMMGMITNLLSCQEIPLAGISVQYTDSSTTGVTLQLDNECNADCQCNTRQYVPVCGTHNNIAYFSPCHAGCSNYNEMTMEYSNCSCIEDTIRTSQPSTAASGICIGQCWQYYIYSVILAVVTCTLLMNGTTLLNIVLRCVPDHSRDYALGIVGFSDRALGSFIGPILFGTLIDRACILWHEECGVRGQCWAYDRSSIALSMLLIGVILKAITVVIYIVALCTYQAPKEENEADNDGAVNKGFDTDDAI